MGGAAREPGRERGAAGGRYWLPGISRPLASDGAGLDRYCAAQDAGAELRRRLTAPHVVFWAWHPPPAAGEGGITSPGEGRRQVTFGWLRYELSAAGQ